MNDFTLPGVPLNAGRRGVLRGTAALLVAPAVGQAAPQTAGAIAVTDFARWDATQLVLDNGAARRVLRLPDAENPWLCATDYRTAAAPSRFFTGHDGAFKSVSDEFRVLVNDVQYDRRSRWQLLGVSSARDDLQGSGAEVHLRSVDGQLEVRLQYLMYPGLPLVRKQVAFTNGGRADVALDSIESECFNLEPYWGATMSWVYSDYGRRKSLPPFTGGAQDALVALHNPDWGEGVVLGNEAAGVNKFTAAFVGTGSFRTGLSPRGSSFPYKRFLAPGARFVSPRVFSIVYAGAPRFETVLNTVVPDFVRRHMGIRLSKLATKPHFVYNTWEPFGVEINEELLRATARAAASAGIKEFVIDDGWSDSYGDWSVDKTKFPNGLRPLTDYIKSLGMKPGLWVSIGSADATSKVFKAHPEWFAKNSHGERFSVHIDGDTSRYTACFSTGWRDYIQGVLLDLTRDHGLEYLKLDFAVVTSPYRFDTIDVGCYATDHPGHRDHAESMSVNYDVMWSVFDALHAAHPEVFIDCTFEAMGALQLIDYAMLKHAEGNWLSNFNEPGQRGDLRIRQMAWWRAPAMPATALVIGNAALNDAGFMMHLRSLAGALPILLGDPSKLTSAQQARCRRFSDWLARLAARHDVLSFRQDLDGFGEPALGGWDGFQRVNTDTRSGGLVGVFRHGAPDATRQVRVTGLDPLRSYLVRDEDGRTMTELSGRQLAARGFAVTLTSEFDGRLFELTRQG